MNREFLKNLGLEDDVVDKVMAEYGRSMQELKPTKEKFEELQTEKQSLEKKLNELQQTLASKEESLQSLDELKKQVESYKIKDLKTNIAVQAGIPLELADRLTGETEEEIKADAEKIAEYVQQKQTLPLRPTEPEKVDPEEKAYEKIIENL